jgi:autotransporter-associated beta strand protein
MASVLPAGGRDNSNRLTKDGSGTWTLSGANVYGGITTLTAGVLSVSTIADGGLTPTLTTVANNATVTASSTAGLAVGQYVISPRVPVGTTIASIVDGTTFTLSTGTGVTAGTAQVSTIGTPSNLGIAPATASFLVFNGGTLQYTGANASTNRNFTINAGKIATLDVTTNNLTLSGASTATNGALTKTGAGTLTLSGANLYSGATTVNQGTLLVNNTDGSGTGTSNVSVTAGTLGGNGSISGTVTLGDGVGSADAILAPGNSIDSIDTGNLTFGTDGSYAVELNGTSVTCDVTNVTGTVSIDPAATLTVSLTGALAGGQEYFIVVNDDVDAVNGTFASLAQDAVVGNYGGTDLKISYTGDSGSNAITGGNDIVLYTDASGTPYDTWATGSEPFDGDANGDSVDDGLAWLLGAATPSANALGKLPTVATPTGFLTLEFDRVTPYAPAKLYVEYGNDLVGWTKVGPIVGDDTLVGGIVVEVDEGSPDGVLIKIPTSLDGGGGKLFARLSAEEN